MSLTTSLVPSSLVRRMISEIWSALRFWVPVRTRVRASANSPDASELTSA